MFPPACDTCFDMGSGQSRIAVVAVVLVAALAGIWYVARLRAENERLRTHAVTAAAPAPATAENPPAAAPPAQVPPAAAPPAAAAGPRTLTEAQRDALLAELRKAPIFEGQVWFEVVPNDPEAVAFQQQLQKLFEEAGWSIHPTKTASFPIKPGIYVFSADEDPPSWVQNAIDGLEAAGIEVTAGRGYRAYYDQKKKDNPSWNGFEMTPDQKYVIVIGPQARG